MDSPVGFGPQKAIAQIWPFLENKPPVTVDWQPWNHTFGGNHNFNMILANGGTLYIDVGKPGPGLIDKIVLSTRSKITSQYWRELSQTQHVN